MSQANNQLNNSLHLTNSISSLSRQSVQDLLGISRPTLTLYQGYINSIKGINELGWSYVSNQRGFSRKSIFILWNFNQLVKTVGVPQAILNLKTTISEVSDDI